MAAWRGGSTFQPVLRAALAAVLLLATGGIDVTATLAATRPRRPATNSSTRREARTSSSRITRGTARFVCAHAGPRDRVVVTDSLGHALLLRAYRPPAHDTRRARRRRLARRFDQPERYRCAARRARGGPGRTRMVRGLPGRAQAARAAEPAPRSSSGCSRWTACGARSCPVTVSLRFTSGTGAASRASVPRPPPPCDRDRERDHLPGGARPYNRPRAAAD